MNTTLPNTTIIVSSKSMVLALVLSFFLGPLGMLYATVSGGIIMFLFTIPVFLFTGGFGLVITLPLGMVWSAMAVNSYNNKLLGRR